MQVQRGRCQTKRAKTTGNASYDVIYQTESVQSVSGMKSKVLDALVKLTINLIACFNIY